jgi:hypothetical protein
MGDNKFYRLAQKVLMPPIFIEKSTLLQVRRSYSDNVLPNNVLFR